MVGPKNSRTFRYSTLAALAAAVLLGVYLYMRPHVEIVDVSFLENPVYGHAKGYSEEYFSREFPGALEIEAYWKNSTVVITDPQFGNIVYYFDDDHHFISWIGGGLNTYEWALFPKQQLLKLGSRSRHIVIQRFCIRSVENPESTREDNCRLIAETSTLYRGGRASTSEHRKGDIFGLLGRKNPPFPLPGKGPISFESLLARLRTAPE